MESIERRDKDGRRQGPWTVAIKQLLAERNLTKWEAHFLRTLRDQRSPPTDRQKDKLLEIDAITTRKGSGQRRPSWRERDEWLYRPRRVMPALAHAMRLAGYDLTAWDWGPPAEPVRRA